MSFTFCSYFSVKIKLHQRDTIDEFFHNSPGAPSGAWALLILATKNAPYGAFFVYIINNGS